MEYDNNDLVPVEEYRKAVSGLKDLAAEICAADKLSKEDADKLRRRVAIEAMKARQVRRAVFLSLERRKHGVIKYSEESLEQEAGVLAIKDLLEAGDICLQVIAASVQKITDIEDKLSIDIGTFHERNPLPDGASESKCDLLKRRIQYEIDLSSEKAAILSECQKERVQHTSALKGYKKFFQAAIAPLEELITKVQKVHSAVGGLPDALGGLTPAHLPVALYSVQRNFIAALGPGAVAINGSVNAARTFIKAGKHMTENSVATELYPLTLLVELKPSSDESPLLKFYFRPSTQRVVAEAKGFEHAVLMSSAPDSEEHQGLFHEGALVTGITASWIDELAQKQPVDGAYDTAALVKVVTSMLEEIDYRRDVNSSFAFLKNRSCLNAAGIMSAVQKYLPSYPPPKVAVGDVKLDSAVDEKSSKKSKQIGDGGELSKTVQFKIELESIIYKIVGLISTNYPNQPPQFKLRIKRKDDDKRAGLQVPAAILNLAPPVAQLTASGPSVSGVQYPSVTKDSKAAKKRKRKECSDYSSISLEGDYTNEVQDNYLRYINIEVVRNTPISMKGHVLMRQILASVYFVEAVHPYVVGRGVAGGWTGTQGSSIDEFCTSLHAPADFRLLYHNKEPLFRGREVQLPIHWDSRYLRWTYNQPCREAELEQMEE